MHISLWGVKPFIPALPKGFSMSNGIAERSLASECDTVPSLVYSVWFVSFANITLTQKASPRAHEGGRSCRCKASCAREGGRPGLGIAVPRCDLAGPGWRALAAATGMVGQPQKDAVEGREDEEHPLRE